MCSAESARQAHQTNNNAALARAIDPSPLNAQILLWLPVDQCRAEPITKTWLLAAPITPQLPLFPVYNFYFPIGLPLAGTPQSDMVQSSWLQDSFPFHTFFLAIFGYKPILG